jgi:hypothetical protein
MSTPRTTFGNITNFRSINDADDDIFIGESFSAEELVSRARAKAEARNEIIVVDDDEDSPSQNINPPQIYPPIIHQPQPVTTKPSASNQSLIDLSLDDDDGMGMDTLSLNAINDKHFVQIKALRRK